MRCLSKCRRKSSTFGPWSLVLGAWSVLSSPWSKSGCIRRTMHPQATPTRLPRWGPRRRRRCSSFKYSRYSQSSRRAGGAPRSSRCDARLSPRAVRGRESAFHVVVAGSVFKPAQIPATERLRSFLVRRTAAGLRHVFLPDTVHVEFRRRRDDLVERFVEVERRRLRKARV